MKNILVMALFLFAANISHATIELESCQKEREFEKGHLNGHLEDLKADNHSNLIDLNNYYEGLKLSNWEILKKNCPSTALDLFFIHATIKNDFFSILTSKGYPLNEFNKYPLNKIHQKILKTYAEKKLARYKCGVPKKSTRIDLRALSTFKHLFAHPDMPRVKMSTINLCRNEVNKKIKKFLQFKDRSRCNGMSYFLNGNLEGTFKGEWVKKDLFCEGFRSYQILRLISKHPNHNLDLKVLDTLATFGPFSKNPRHDCKHYYYHPKRLSCYPVD